MTEKIKLSALVDKIEEVITESFGEKTFWITAEITDVRKQPDKRWCFLKFIEKDSTNITAEIKGVFWARTYHTIEQYEKVTKQEFKNGIKIDCNVRVRFNKRFGIDLEVLNIDYTLALGELELEKQKTLEKLVKEKSAHFYDGLYKTKNNSLPLPIVIQNIALVTASNSDGQRDFKKEIEHNKYGFAINIVDFCCPVQGDNASRQMIEQLRAIENQSQIFDAVVIVRGGGSQTDFKCFNDYELAKYVASFPIPIITGIGHDSNTSIVDLMARQLKTPTKVAAFIVELNLNFDNNLEDLKERFFQAVEDLIENAKDDLKELKRVVKNSSPSTILNRGFAIITSGEKIVTSTKSIKTNTVLQTIMKDETIHSTVTKKTKNEKRFDI